MNILFVHEVDWLNKVVFDIHSLSESLSLLGHQVYAIDYENTWQRSSFWDLGSLKTKEIKGISRAFPGASVYLRRPGFIKIPGLSRLSASLTHYLAIAKTIREKRIEAIVLYSVATNGLQTLRLAQKFNIPVLFRSIDILNQLVPYPLLRPITRWLERKVYSRADMILTLTPKLSQYVINIGAKEDRVEVLPMPVDTNLFHPAVNSTALCQKWGFTQKDKIIVFIGTLFEFSGLDILIPRFPEVIQQIPEAKLLIVGDGPQRSKLETLIAKSNLSDKITITGFEPYQTMPQYINLASICINSFLITDATRDIFPGKIVQYLACGKAVIATSLPGMIAMIPGENQGIIYVNSPDEMIGEIISLLKSTKRRQQLEQAALDYVKQVHCSDKIARQLEARIKQIIKNER
jgi:glycosyltransferase involved in cell wall biosynthesis